MGDWDDVPNQFVELIGPKHTPIGNWTLDFWGYNFEGDRITKAPEYRKVFPASATIGGTPNLASGEVDKGWGFYLLGNSAVTSKDLWLFPDEQDPTVDTQAIFIDGAYSKEYGAMALKRSMGAYADAIIWGGGAAKKDKDSGYNRSVVQGFVDEGFKVVLASAAAGQIIANTAKSPTELYWTTYNSNFKTYGTYNYYSQNIAIPYVTSSAEPTTPPEIGVAIVDIIMNNDTNKIELIFKLWSTNGIAVDSSDFTWYIESATTLDFAEPTRHEITGETITAGADGSEAAYSVILDLSESDSARFFKVIAVPTL